MDVEISRAPDAETPASCISSYVTEHVTALMSLGGIEAISSRKYECGFGSKLHVTISPFRYAPEEVRAQGVVIKDAIATILSVANITRVVMKPEEEDVAAMKKLWDDSVRTAMAANGASGQDSSEWREGAGNEN